MLGIAWRDSCGRTIRHAVVSDETELVFAGFAAFLDPPKESAGAALAALEAESESPSRSSPATTSSSRSISAQLELAGDRRAHRQGDRADGRSCTASARGDGQFVLPCQPVQKDRVILALKARGHVVGYLGDGINDAPSLHSADVGISVDCAVDVAKEAADMILLEHGSARACMTASWKAGALSATS